MVGRRRSAAAQQICSLLKRRIDLVRRLTVGDMITTGLDGGREFSFAVTSTDGSEFVVSVVQTRESNDTKESLGNAARLAAMRQEARGNPTIPNKEVAARERARKRFLGITD